MKLLQKLRTDPRVDEVCVEQGLCDVRPSFFVHLNLGWALAERTGNTPQHCFGEDTLRNVQRTLKRVVPCECEECCSLASGGKAKRDQSGFVVR